jgi:precorrin-6B methylase 2
MTFQSITAVCLERLRRHLRPGDHALDATAGNGHDTLALAAAVGPTGRVDAIDRQEAALRATAERLSATGLAPIVELHHGDHALLADLLPPTARGHLRAAVFNLGFLPGGDKALTTQTESTLRALAAAWEWLAPGGLLAIVCYPGHAEGAREAEAVESWAGTLSPPPATREKISPGPTRRPAPFLLTLTKRGRLWRKGSAALA